MTDSEIKHQLNHTIGNMGGQDIAILDSSQELNQLYQYVINTVKNREKGTLPLEWSGILPKSILERLKRDPIASEILYHYFYGKLGGIAWKHWNSTKRIEKCTKIAEKCLENDIGWLWN